MTENIILKLQAAHETCYEKFSHCQLKDNLKHWLDLIPPLSVYAYSGITAVNLIFHEELSEMWETTYACHSVWLRYKFRTREVTEGKIRFNPGKQLEKPIKTTPQLRFSANHSPKLIADPFFQYSKWHSNHSKTTGIKFLI